MGRGSNTQETTNINQHPFFYFFYHRSILSSYLIYPIRGEAIIGGIYDIGFKRGFMGYIGLLLNAPYKIDSMVWRRLI
jgi:hypothetical protein